MHPIEFSLQWIDFPSLPDLFRKGSENLSVIN